MMSRDWYEALRRHLPDDLDDSFWDSSLPEEQAPSVEETLDRSYYETMSTYDQSARTDRVGPTSEQEGS